MFEVTETKEEVKEEVKKEVTGEVKNQEDIQEQITKEFKELQGYREEPDEQEGKTKEKTETSETKDDVKKGEQEGTESKVQLSDKERGLIEELKEERKKRQTSQVDQNELKKLQDEVKELRETTKKSSDPWSEISDTQLDTGKIHWQEQYRKAIRDEDAELEAKAQKYLDSIDQVVKKRLTTKEAPKEDKKVDDMFQTIIQLDAKAKVAVPDFYKEGTEANNLLLLKAKEYPPLVELGDLGGLLAGALVILEHPELVGGKIRKEVTKDLGKKIEESLTSTDGTNSTPSTKRKLTHAENLELADKLKRGEITSVG